MRNAYSVGRRPRNDIKLNFSVLLPFADYSASTDPLLDMKARYRQPSGQQRFVPLGETSVNLDIAVQAHRRDTRC